MDAPSTAPARSAARSPRALLVPLLGVVLCSASASASAQLRPDPSLPSSAADRALAAGDRAWAERGRETDGGWRADPGAVARAVEGYARAVETAPDSLVARCKLLAALYFEGEHVAVTADERREVFDRGKDAAEAALGRMASLAGLGAEHLRAPDPEARAQRLVGAGISRHAAALYFWSAVHWGLWGDAYGRLAAAREGVAGRVRDDALTAMALDSTVERAGPHRVLGRLHAEAPKIPFFTGWVDRDRAISELERAVELAPDEPLNRLYLAEALLAHRPARSPDARAQLRAILDRPVVPPRAVEDASARRRARELLEEAQR